MTQKVRATFCLLLWSLSLGACAGEGLPVPEGGGQVAALADDITHPFFSSVSVDDKDSVVLSALGDLWVNCWSDDDAVYTTCGDGTGFGATIGEMVVSRVEGRPGDSRDPLRGTLVASGSSVGPAWNLGYTRKPTGMLCANGELFIAVQDLKALAFTDAPAATIVRSVDKGRTWSWDTRAPMFSDHVFTTLMFADFGKNNAHAPDGYAYVYGLDDNWSATYSTREPQSKLYLARVPLANIQNRSNWEFWTGFGEGGEPLWDANIEKRAPVLEDPERVYQAPLDRSLAHQNMYTMSQGGVVYNPALKRYIFSTWTMYTFELYEAPQPWGPWKHFHSKDFGVFPWTEEAAGGYGTSIPSKFISEDGQTMWMHSNVWEAGVIHYQYALRKVHVAPFAESEAQNPRAPESLATPERGAVPLVRVARSGHPELLFDGVLDRQSEESWNGERKTEDYWGYTWSRSVHVNELRYTTGKQDTRGGWFTDLAVQVRRGNAWVPATGLKITPAYSADANVLGNKTYTLSFDEAATDGVRIYGAPGGAEAFTNIAELSVHYE
jgi:hypothetical protein